MPLPVVTFPLDPTGTNVNNRIQGELHTMPMRQVRAIAVNHGGFFTESLVLYDNASNALLVSGTQYHAVELYGVPSAKYGKEICAIILITDPTVSDTVRVTYQAIGGEYSTSAVAIRSILEDLALDTRPASWPGIIGRPSSFPPSNHLHDAGDIYGFEYVVHALERVRRAIEIGDDLAHDSIYKYIEENLEDVISPADVNTLIAASFTAHNAASNPHSAYRLKTDITENALFLDATTATTVLDLSQGYSVYVVSIKANTLFSFINVPVGFVTFGLITLNDATAGRAVAFPAGTTWAGGYIPPRTTTAGAVDEWWFERRNQGLPFTGSLAVADAK